MSDDDEDLFPHEEDDIGLSLDCYDWEYLRWYKAPVDLEHIHRENAERKETEYFRLISGSYREMEDAMAKFLHKNLFQVQYLPEGALYFYVWRRDDKYYDKYKYLDKLQQLKDKVVWRIHIDKNINRQYEAMSSFLCGCKYRLGT